MLGENDQFCNDESIFDWKKLTTAQFNHATFAGGHFFIHEHEDIFIEQLNNLLSLTTISEKGEIYERSICYR
jgi:surfactin synthase thioesterase subunit